MCILFLYTNPQPHPQTYRLIIISNRDEFYTRPSQQINQIEDVIGGRDMEQDRDGGMWLGISTQKFNDIKLRFGALLNVTGEERKHGVKGRGFIVTDYLEAKATAKEYMNSLLDSDKIYNGYNFVAVEVRENDITTNHCSNISKLYTRYDGKQTLGFGNTVPEIPLRKVVNGTEEFSRVIEENNHVNTKQELVEKLLNLLKSEEKHLPDALLEKRQPVWYGGLSAIYVKLVQAGYGTRTHSVILVDYDWNMEFFEATMKEPIDIENPVWLNDVIKARL